MNFFDNNGEIENYIVKGKATDLKVDLYKDIILSETNLSFFADKEDILVKNIFGKIDGIEINNGDIKLNLENGILLNSNFISNLNLDNEKIKKFNDLLGKFNPKVSIKGLKGNFNNNILINLDKTYKVTNYNYSLSGKVKKVKLNYFKLSIRKISLISSILKLFFIVLENSIFTILNIARKIVIIILYFISFIKIN